MPKPTSKSQTTQLNATKYAALKRDVQALTRRANRETDQSKVAAYWELGERIASERIDAARGYRTAVLRDLAIDTRVPFRNLHYALAFRETYRRLPTHALSWGHYRLLLDRPDTETRAHYQKLAIDGALSVHALASRIASDRREVTGTALLSRPHKPSFLYRAVVVNIIDGDTLDLRVDLGFFTKHEGRFRLAGIDCPELLRQVEARPANESDAPDPGRAARDFVFARLTTAKTIVVKTERTDIYGRFVAHLFYSDRDTTIDDCFQSGTHLNTELLEAHHAIPMM